MVRFSVKIDALGPSYSHCGGPAGSGPAKDFETEKKVFGSGLESSWPITPGPRLVQVPPRSNHGAHVRTPGPSPAALVTSARKVRRGQRRRPVCSNPSQQIRTLASGCKPLPTSRWPLPSTLGPALRCDLKCPHGQPFRGVRLQGVEALVPTVFGDAGEEERAQARAPDRNQKSIDDLPRVPEATSTRARHAQYRTRAYVWTCGHCLVIPGGGGGWHKASVPVPGAGGDRGQKKSLYN